ncbi:zinc ribbon domain-containing protein [Bacillus massiliigorillae]|uniref:zinc ribbon domain-containing protein n=1 Tax=Bacillus massiliigorillae TaxID=1243664 RepID=UPI0003A9691C|nr:zinc ribbon domain-containing protein [Bacillus massiliigorillae]
MKYCQSCGKQISEGDHSCEACGFSAEHVAKQTMQETSATAQLAGTTVPPVAKKTFGRKTLILTTIFVLLAAVSVTAAMLLQKTPKELYLLAEYNNLQQMKADFDDQYGDALAFQEKMLEKPSSSKVEFTGGIDSPSLNNDPDFTMFKEFLNKASISFKAEQDPIKQQNYSNIAVNIDKKKAIDAEVFQTKERIGIKIPALYEKAFYFNLDEYGSLMRTIDPNYVGPEKLDFSDYQFDMKDYQFTEKEKKYIQEHYATFITEQLDEKNFSVQKSVDYEQKGEKLTLKEVTLKLSSSETEKLINNFMDYLIKDTELHNMLVTRMEKMSKAGMASVDPSVALPDAKQLKEELVQSLKDMKESMKDVKYPAGFTSTLLLDKNEQIVDRKMKMTIDDGTEKVNLVVNGKDVPYGDNKQFKEIKMEITSGKTNADKLVVQYNNDIATTGDKRNEDMKVHFSIASSGEPEQGLDISMKSTFNGKKASKQDIDRVIEFVVNEGSQSNDAFVLKGKVKQNNDINLKEEYSKQKFAIEVTGGEGTETITFKADVDTETVLKDKIDMPKINEKEAINLVGISENDIAKITEEMTANLLKIGQKFGLIPEGAGIPTAETNSKVAQF